MKKRIITMLLIVTLAASITGCAGKKPGDRGADEKATLTWLVPGDSQPDLSSVMTEVNKITENEIGAKLEMQFIDTGSFSEKMKLNMASGTQFDLCFTGFVNNYKQAVNNGGLMDITDMIDEVDGLKAAIPEYFWDMAKINGKIYAVPNVQIVATANSVIVFDDIAKKYNFDWSSVNKIDDIEPYLEMVKKGEPDVYPYRPNYGTIQWYTDKYESPASMLAFPKGGKSADELCYLYETEEFKHGAQQLWNWYQKGYIRSDALSIGDDTADYKNGKYAVANEVWKPGAEAETKLITSRDNTFVKIEKPYMSKAKGTATMIAVGQNSKNPQKALEFIKLVNTNKELYNLICFGIEGKHYNMENGKVKIIENSGYNQQGNCWKFGNTFNAFITDEQPDTVWEETEKVNNESEKSTLLGFVFDNENVKSQISNIATVVSEYEVMNRGVKDPASYMDEFIAKLKEAGIEKVYDEMKKQLDEYFASQN